jgi:hypothetical protein
VYLAAVAAVVAAVFAGALSVVNNRPQEQPVLAKGTDGRATASERESEDEIRADANRVPVWIAPTAKYDYTPSPVEPPKRRNGIGEDARGAQAKAPPRTRPQPREAANADVVPRMIDSRRDNDPFFRD